MSNLRRTIFISDLHLDDNQPGITTQFLHLLQQLQPPIDALYILGDLFEFWIGDDYGVTHFQSIINALKLTTSRGIPIYYLHGNRDFLIGKTFLRETGCQLLPDETKIFLYGHPVLLMHGDTLCTKDIAYIKARKKMRNRYLQALFLLLPLSLRIKIAEGMRLKSQQHTSSVSYEIMDVSQDAVMQVMQKNDVRFLIHGHTHKPGFHEFSEQLPATRIVLGSWHEGGNMLVWDESGHKELIQL